MRKNGKHPSYVLRNKISTFSLSTLRVQSNFIIVMPIHVVFNLIIFALDFMRPGHNHQRNHSLE